MFTKFIPHSTLVKVRYRTNRQSVRMAAEMRQRAKILTKEHLFRFHDSLSEGDRTALSAEIEVKDLLQVIG